MNQYDVIKTIGKGSFGACILVKRKNDDMHLVLKQINVMEMSQRERNDAMNEVNVLSMLDHDNIIGYYDSFIENGTLHILMEYANAGDIQKEIKKRTIQKKYFTENEILSWFTQILYAVQYLHNTKNILHRDLKSQNIFLTLIDGRSIVKLGDMGIAKILTSDTLFARTVIGTPYYLSPEICQDLNYDHKSDIWSLGCVLYEIASLKQAFNAGSLPALVLKILKGNYPPIPSFYSSDLRDLVSVMLQTDPANRPTIDDIINTPFIQNYIHSGIASEHDPLIANSNASLSNNIPMSIAKSSTQASSATTPNVSTPVKSNSSTTSSSTVKTPVSSTKSRSQPTTPINKRTPSRGIMASPITTPIRSISSSSTTSSNSSSSSSTPNQLVRKPPVPKPTTPLFKRAPIASSRQVSKSPAICRSASSSTGSTSIGSSTTSSKRPLVKQSSASSLTSNSSSSSNTTTTTVTTPIYTPPVRPTLNISSSSSSSSSSSTPRTRHSLTGSNNTKSISNPSLPTTTSSSSSSTRQPSSSSQPQGLSRRLSSSNLNNSAPTTSTTTLVRPTTPTNSSSSSGNGGRPSLTSSTPIPIRPPSSSSSTRPPSSGSSRSSLTSSSSTSLTNRPRSQTPTTPTTPPSSSPIYTMPTSNIVINKRPSSRSSIESKPTPVIPIIKQSSFNPPLQTNQINQNNLINGQDDYISPVVVTNNDNNNNNMIQNTTDEADEKDIKGNRYKKLAMRTNALRHFCNSILGEELYKRAYNFVREMNMNPDEDNDENTQQTLQDILGDKIYYLKYLQQLIYCESQIK